MEYPSICWPMMRGHQFRRARGQTVITAMVGQLTSLAAELSIGVSSPDLPSRLKLVCRSIDQRIVFTTSFGLEDQAITHAIFTSDLSIEVVTLDTGRLFAETYDVWAETERCYRRRICGIFPDRRDIEALVAQQGINGFRASIEARRACCEVRKVEPLARALAGASLWITGLRAQQSSHRAATPFAEVDEPRRLVKINPLFDWSRDEVLAYVVTNHIPYNALHDRGFLSIGCAPCTRAIQPGEPERAGRWWWEQAGHGECGLHLPGQAHQADRSSLQFAEGG
jgi:phosphoadenosine phosphosulfate reductase